MKFKRTPYFTRWEYGKDKQWRSLPLTPADLLFDDRLPKFMENDVVIVKEDKTYGCYHRLGILFMSYKSKTRKEACEFFIKCLQQISELQWTTIPQEKYTEILAQVQ